MKKLQKAMAIMLTVVLVLSAFSAFWEIIDRVKNFVLLSAKSKAKR